MVVVMSSSRGLAWCLIIAIATIGLQAHGAFAALAWSSDRTPTNHVAQAPDHSKPLFPPEKEFDGALTDGQDAQSTHESETGSHAGKAKGGVNLFQPAFELG